MEDKLTVLHVKWLQQLNAYFILLPLLTQTHTQRDSPNLEWFPRLQCMSLRTEEAEPEQNEMKDLQQQLKETTSIVRILSQQLGELRDRVREEVN